MKNNYKRQKTIFSDPIINFYVVSLRFEEEEVPSTFPEENRSAFFEIINSLSENWRTVLVSYYGLDGSPRKSFREIAESFDPPKHLSGMPVICSKAERKLLHPSYREKLRILLYTEEDCRNRLAAAEEKKEQISSVLATDSKVSELLECLKRAEEIVRDINRSEISWSAARNAEEIVRYAGILGNIEKRNGNPCGLASKKYSYSCTQNDLEHDICSYLKLIESGDFVVIKKETVKMTLSGIDSDTTIADLDLTTRTYNCLLRHGIYTVNQIARLSKAELLGIRNFGSQSYKEVLSVCDKLGIELK